jgi:hypothetical protein
MNPHQSAPHYRLLYVVPLAVALIAGMFVVGRVALSSANTERIDLVDTLIRTFIPGPSVSWVEHAPQREFRYSSNGLVTFTEAEDDIERLEGRVTIVEKRDGRTQRMDFRADGANGVRKIYKVDGREQPLDDAGKRWLAGTIAKMLRETPTFTQQRLQRRYAKGGAAAVVTEIERIQSDPVRRDYIERLVKLGTLDDGLLGRLVGAVAGIKSEYDQRSAFQAVMGNQALSPPNQAAVLDAVAKMHSAFEQRGVLESLTSTLGREPVVIQAWLTALAAIHSDYDARMVLEDVAKREMLSGAQVEMVLQASMEIRSDFERAMVLKAMARHVGTAGVPALALFLRSAGKINSDFERRGVLTTLVERVDLDRPGYQQLLVAVAAIHSGFEKQLALEAIAKRMPRDPELVSRFREVARELSDHERTQAERGLDPLNL